MEFTTFVRKPFKVEAIEITTDNIEELSKMVGKLITKEDGSMFIDVDRRKVPNVYKVHPGFWLTRMTSNGKTFIRCYSNHVFNLQFVGITIDIQEFLNHLGIVDDNPESFPQEGKIQDGETTN